jgi:hypothetical protein
VCQLDELEKKAVVLEGGVKFADNVLSKNLLFSQFKLAVTKFDILKFDEIEGVWSVLNVLGYPKKS